MEGGPWKEGECEGIGQIVAEEWEFVYGAKARKNGNQASHHIFCTTHEKDIMVNEYELVGM